MRQKGKSVIILLVLLLVLSLAVAGVGFYSLQKEKTRVMALTEDLETVKVEKRAVQENLEKSRRTTDELNIQLKDAYKKAESLNRQLEEAKREKDQVYAQTESLMKDLQSKLQQKDDEKRGLEQRQTQMQNEIDNLQAKIQSLQAEKAAEPKKEVELGKIVVATEQASAQIRPQAAPPLEGKVLVVNKDYDFAVINLGSRDGVNIGQTFSVSCDNKDIGDIQVEKIQDTMSACAFVSKEIKNKVKEGDRVIRK